MTSLNQRVSALIFAFTASAGVFAQLPAPPENPPFISNDSPPSLRAASVAPVQFSIGDPTDEEQLFLELINRARKDANAEAQRLLALKEPSVHFYFTNTSNGVDTNLMKAQFSTNPPVPPLSFNAKLTAAARGHSQYQFDVGLQTHFGPGTSNLAQRLQAVAYPFRNAGENVYVYAENIEVGHAGFEVDWSNAATNGGMQTPPGHRDSIHSAVFKEVGIGVLKGSNQVGGNFPVGPMLITQDFGLPQTPLTYVTGVAYYDLNGNNFYDVGEGLSGIRVSVAGLDTFAITSFSGGYSVPVPPNATYTVTFSDPNVPSTSTQVAITTNNFKLDFKPAFITPTLATSPSVAFGGSSNLFTLVKLPGATGYRARARTFSDEPLQGAENGLTGVAASTFGDYPPVSTTVHATGARSFHLAHRSGISAPGNQNISFPGSFYVKPGARVDFKSRLGIASSSQVARLEISTNNGAAWSTIWSQAGVVTTIDNSEKIFSDKTASLASLEGDQIQIRFNFTVTGSYFPQPANAASNFDDYGWYFDDIRILNAGHLSTPTFSDFGSDAAFRFTPPSTGDYVVDFQAFNGARVFPFGPLFFITAQSDPPVLAFVNEAITSPDIISFTFELETGTTTPYALDSGLTPTGPWTTETNAFFSGPFENRHTVTVPINGNARFYRVRAN